MTMSIITLYCTCNIMLLVLAQYSHSHKITSSPHSSSRFVEFLNKADSAGVAEDLTS